MPIRFDYACFISYTHAKEELVTRFVDQFRSALEASLEPLVDIPVYFDAARLKPGYLYNEAIAAALCRSVSMVAVYVPVYERRPYCGREFEAMVQLEEQRLKLAGLPPGRGLIIPVVLRGFDDLPPSIAARRQAVDFSHFSLADRPLARNRASMQKIDEIAAQIHAHCRALRPLEDRACAPCDAFELPPESQLKPWRQGPQPLPGFPNR